MFDVLSAKPTRASKARVKSTGTYGSTQASKKRRNSLGQWAEHVHRLRDLASRLPDVPDESSINTLRSIEQESRELLAIHNDIDFRPMENPKSMVEHVYGFRDHPLRLPTTSLVSPTRNLFGGSTNVPRGYPFERFSGNVGANCIAGPVDDSSWSIANAATFDKSLAEKTCIGELAVSQHRKFTLLTDSQSAV